MRGFTLIIVFLLLFPPFSLAEQATNAVQSELDPEEGKYFIISTVFETASVPRAQDRVSILSKLASFGRTQVGYGLSLRGFQTSVRPQVYWSSGEGVGGFYTFGNYDFKPRRLYALTLIARPGEFLSLYIQERGRKSSEEFPRGEITSKVIFLGGHDLKGTSTPKNNAQFTYKVSQEAERTEHVGVMAALVASTPTIKDSIDKLITTLEGAPETLSTSLSSQEVKLWEVSSINQADQ